MDRIDDESFGFDYPSFADELVGREPFQGLEAAAEVVCGDEALEMGAELIVVVVVEAFDRRVLDRSVHALDLTVGPRMPGLCEPMFDAVRLAGSIERMPTPPGCQA